VVCVAVQRQTLSPHQKVLDKLWEIRKVRGPNEDMSAHRGFNIRGVSRKNTKNTMKRNKSKQTVHTKFKSSASDPCLLFGTLSGEQEPFEDQRMFSGNPLFVVWSDLRTRHPSPHRPSPAPPGGSRGVPRSDGMYNPSREFWF